MHTMMTADGYSISHGMRVWTSTLQQGKVDLTKDDGGWITVQLDNGYRLPLRAHMIHCTKPPQKH